MDGWIKIGGYMNTREMYLDKQLIDLTNDINNCADPDYEQWLDKLEVNNNELKETEGAIPARKDSL